MFFEARTNAESRAGEHGICAEESRVGNVGNEGLGAIRRKGDIRILARLR